MKIITISKYMKNEDICLVQISNIQGKDKNNFLCHVDNLADIVKLNLNNNL